MIIRLGWFPDRSSVDGVMARARRAGTLILDLRGNAGGSEDGLVRLASHLFDRRVTIATIRERRRTRVLESRPARHPFRGALYVLIDSRSASAAEVLAYLVQLKGRGVVVGDRSAGEVMGARIHQLTSGTSAVTVYGLSIADGDVLMPDGARLEGRGVLPDALVLPTAADLAAGRDPVLARALAMAAGSRRGEVHSVPDQ
jgi:carboxyl-terminal processing protease